MTVWTKTPSEPPPGALGPPSSAFRKLKLGRQREIAAEMVRKIQVAKEAHALRRVKCTTVRDRILWTSKCQDLDASQRAWRLTLCRCQAAFRLFDPSTIKAGAK